MPHARSVSWGHFMPLNVRQRVGALHQFESGKFGKCREPQFAEDVGIKHFIGKRVLHDRGQAAPADSEDGQRGDTTGRVSGRRWQTRYFPKPRPVWLASWQLDLPTYEIPRWKHVVERLSEQNVPLQDRDTIKFQELAGLMPPVAQNPIAVSPGMLSVSLLLMTLAVQDMNWNPGIHGLKLSQMGESMRAKGVPERDPALNMWLSCRLGWQSDPTTTFAVQQKQLPWPVEPIECDSGVVDESPSSIAARTRSAETSTVVEGEGIIPMGAGGLDDS